MSSTIIAPPSTPTYHDLSRASEGEARTVEASASATASFRIIIPFLGCHYGQPQLPTPGLVSAQANKFRLLLPKRNKSETLECVAATALQEAIRSEERRVGKEWVSTCRSRWSP